MKVVFLLLVLVLAGCSATTIQPVGLLNGAPKATLYYGSPDQPRTPHEVSIEPLTAVMSRASWTSTSYISKGGFWLRYPGGREFFFAVGFDFFRERGVPGSFMIRAEDREAYAAILAAVR